MTYKIRKARKEDCVHIHGLIQELAEYQNMPDGPKIDISTLEKDGFGPTPFFQCNIAIHLSGECVGYVLYYYTYSSWKGRAIYMEDLYVKEKFRGKGIGQNLWRSVVKAGLAQGCTLCNFGVVTLNKSSIDFYKKRGAVDLTDSEGWLSFRMKLPEMKRFVEE